MPHISRRLRTWRILSAVLALLLCAAAWRGGALLVSPDAGPYARPAARTVVSLTFNDGLATQYRNARSLLRSHNMHGTFYVASNLVDSGDPHYMTWPQLDELYRDGNEIGGMGRDHSDLTSTDGRHRSADMAYKRDQVCGDKTRLADRGYDPVSFSYPFASFDSTAKSIVKACGYTSGRTVGILSLNRPTLTKTLPPPDPFRILALRTPNGPMRLQDLKRAVTATASEGGGWLPIAFNDVCPVESGAHSSCMASPNPIEAGVLSRFLDWLQDGAPGGVTVATMRQAMGAPVQPSLPTRETAVSLTFDDALASQYALRPTLAAYNEHATFFVPSGPVDIGGPGSMTWEQIEDLAADGHDIGGHTVAHVDLTDPATSLRYKWHQVCDDRERLLNLGINAVSFAYPFAALDQTSEDIVKRCGYRSARGGGMTHADVQHHAEELPPRDPFGFSTVPEVGRGPIELQSLKDAVNATVTHGGGWLTFVFHKICYQGDSDFSACMHAYRPIADTTFDAFLAWMQDNEQRGVRVRSVAEVVDRAGAPPQVTVDTPKERQSVSSPAITVSASAKGPVRLSVYRGSYPTGNPLTVLTRPLVNGSATFAPAQAARDGVYTVQASQESRGDWAYSVPRSFVVKGSSPARARR